MTGVSAAFTAYKNIHCFTLLAVNSGSASFSKSAVGQRTSLDPGFRRDPTSLLN